MTLLIHSNNSSSSDMVSKIHLLAKHCTEVQKSFLNQAAAYFSHKKDDLIFHETFPAYNVYFVLSGIVSLWKENIYSKKQYIRFVKEGELFGFRGSVMETPTYRLSATAFEDSEICHIRKEKFVQVLQENPELHFNILLSYVKELEKIENNFCNNISMNTREKVAEALLIIHGIFNDKQKAQTTNQALFSKNILRRDIADIAGISTGKTINQLTEFRTEGIIAICRSTITLLNPDKIKEIVEKYHE